MVRRRAVLRLGLAAAAGAPAAAAVARAAGAPARTAAASVPTGAASIPTVAGAPPPVGSVADLPVVGAAPKIRWWWPHGLVDPTEIVREVDEIADAGFGGVEIQDVHHSVVVDTDPGGHGWGTPAWLAAVEAALLRARTRGITVDLAIGPSWPAAVPTITASSPAAAQGLVSTVTTLRGATTVSVDPGVLAVQMARSTGAGRLDPTSVRTLDFSGGSVEIAVPDGTWLLFLHREQGTGQLPEGGPHTVPTSYVVDHFSAAGSSAIVEAWNTMILTGPIRTLLGEVGGDLFEDSLEIETEGTLWTRGFLQEFRQRAGYDLLPYLPVVLQQGGRYRYAFDGDAGSGVRDDVDQVLSDLYHEHHLLPLKEFAHGLGMGLRAQPYGLRTDAMRSATVLDVPEGETLGFKNLDDFRVLASARDLAGSRVLSAESAAYAAGAYRTTWNRVVQTVASAFAGGVNQAVLHGFAYRDAPGAPWPGFAPFSPYRGSEVGYAEAWGPRQPTWRHLPDVTGWLTRTQGFLCTGRPQVDLAFFRQQGWAATGMGAPWATNDGVPLGWSHGFVNEATLSLAAAVVRGGRLAPAGPAYKALILTGDVFRSGGHILSVAAARLLLGFALAGLPTVVVGEWSDARVAGLAADGENEALRAVLASLLATPDTRVVADPGAIPAALADLGVSPDVSHGRSSLMHVHRADGDTDYYYLANAPHAESRAATAVEQEVWLTAESSTAVPFVLEAWTGAMTGIDFARAGTRVGIPVALQPGQSLLVVLKPGTPPPVAARVFVGPPILLSEWDLTVEDWNPQGVVMHSLHLSSLTAWSSVPELVDVSGVGWYRTEVDAPGDLGALLSLGPVVDTCRVRVNGRLLPPVDVTDPVVDLGPWLRAGRNAVEIEVATTLFNRLRTISPGVFGREARQGYGLLGPVQLQWYRGDTAR